jgi:hypothetical protein
MVCVEGCTLLKILGHDDVRETMLRPELWGVVGLWRLRGVCAMLREWATAQLTACARVVAVGGAVMHRTLADGKHHRATASVESTDLATLRWSRGCGDCMPVLPSPRHRHCACAHPDGTVVVVGGYNKHALNEQKQLQRVALRWSPGSRLWSRLPELPLDGCGGCGAEAVPLRDGRTMVIGGWSSERREALSAVIALSADGREWVQLAPLRTARHGFASAILADGRVLVLGGLTGRRSNSMTASAELWDRDLSNELCALMACCLCAAERPCCRGWREGARRSDTWRVSGAACRQLAWHMASSAENQTRPRHDWCDGCSRWHDCGRVFPKGRRAERVV